MPRLRSLVTVVRFGAPQALERVHVDEAGTNEEAPQLPAETGAGQRRVEAAEDPVAELPILRVERGHLVVRLDGDDPATRFGHSGDLVHRSRGIGDVHEHPLGAHRIEGGGGERERLRRRDLELSPTACGGGSPASFFDHRLAGIDAYRTTRRTDDPLELEDIAGRSTPDIEHRVAGLQVDERVTGALALAEPL